MTKRTKAVDLARALGAAACGACALLWWILLYANPYGTQGVTGGTFVVGWLMIALAVGGFFASLAVRPAWLFGVFALSFVPVGIYLAGAPGLFRWIAILDLLILLIAVLLRRAPRPSSPA